MAEDSIRLYQLIYASTSLVPTFDGNGGKHIEDILRVAEIRNRKYGITGALTFNELHFAQVLEGTPEAVNSIFARISRDPRHTDVETLQEGEIADRDFSQWAMAYVGDESSMRIISPNARLEDILAGTRRGGALIEMMKYWVSRHL